MLNTDIQDSRTSRVAPSLPSIGASVDGLGFQNKGEKGSGLDIPLRTIEAARGTALIKLQKAFPHLTLGLHAIPHR